MGSVGSNNYPIPSTSNMAGAEDPDGKVQPLHEDADGNLLVNVAAGTITASNPSIGVNGAAEPASSTQVGGQNGGLLQALQVDASKNLLVNLNTALPAGANAIGSVSVSNFPGTQPVSGTVTANQGTAGAQKWLVDGSGVTQPVSGSVTVTQATGTNLHAVIDSGTLTTVSTVTAVTSITNAVSTKSPVNTSGSIVNQTLSATTAQSNSAPANSIGFILEADSSNDKNIRWCIGGTASASVGMLAEPGRDSGFVPCAATVSVCAIASGTNTYSIQWILSA